MPLTQKIIELIKSNSNWINYVFAFLFGCIVFIGFAYIFVYLLGLIAKHFNTDQSALFYYLLMATGIFTYGYFLGKRKEHEKQIKKRKEERIIFEEAMKEARQKNQ